MAPKLLRGSQDFKDFKDIKAPKTDDMLVIHGDFDKDFKDTKDFKDFIDSPDSREDRAG